MAKPHIKDKIIQTARDLFNRRGVMAVSMRDIAEALGISVGNLTYHYPRKEDLTEAVVMDMHQHYRRPEVPKTLQQLNAIFARTQNNTRLNAFYFWHYTELGNISPAIHAAQKCVVKDRDDMLKQAFAGFARDGLFLPEPYPGQFTQLAQAVQILCIYWVPQSKLEADLGTPKDFLACVWSVLVPCLTPEGLAIYERDIQKRHTATTPETF